MCLTESECPLLSGIFCDLTWPPFYAWQSVGASHLLAFYWYPDLTPALDRMWVPSSCWLSSILLSWLVFVLNSMCVSQLTISLVSNSLWVPSLAGFFQCYDLSHPLCLTVCECFCLTRLLLMFWPVDPSMLNSLWVPLSGWLSFNDLTFPSVLNRVESLLVCCCLPLPPKCTFSDSYWARIVSWTWDNWIVINTHC